MERCELLLSNSNSGKQRSEKTSQKWKSKTCSRPCEHCVTPASLITDSQVHRRRNAGRGCVKECAEGILPHPNVRPLPLPLSFSALSRSLLFGSSPSESPGSRCAGVQVQAESRPPRRRRHECVRASAAVGAATRLLLPLRCDI